MGDRYRQKCPGALITTKAFRGGAGRKYPVQPKWGNLGAREEKPQKIHRGEKGDGGPLGGGGDVNKLGGGEKAGVPALMSTEREWGRGCRGGVQDHHLGGMVAPP